MLFTEAKAILLNKTDLIPYTNFDMESFVKDVNRINPRVPLISVSCTRNTGLEEWYQWLSADR